MDLGREIRRALSVPIQPTGANYLPANSVLFPVHCECGCAAETEERKGLRRVVLFCQSSQPALGKSPPFGGRRLEESPVEVNRRTRGVG